MSCVYLTYDEYNGDYDCSLGAEIECDQCINGGGTLNPLLPEEEEKSFCLGFGDWSKFCSNCAHSAKWEELNTLPRVERLAKQENMVRINDLFCALTKRSFYKENKNLSIDKVE